MAEFWECSNAEYHADRSAESHSSLDVYRASPARFHGRYVAKTLPPREPSEAMRLGTALHCAVLEPGRWLAEYAIAPEGIDRRTAAGKTAWAIFEAAAQGREILTREQELLVYEMRRALCHHADAAGLLSAKGRNECSAKWTHECGLNLKARFDRLLECGIDVNLKTAADASPEAFARQAANLGYARGAALYVDGKRALGLVGEHLFVVVSTTPPHEVGVYELDAASLELGRQQNEKTIRDLWWSYEIDDWTPAWSVGIKTISLPKYSFYEDDR